MKNSIITFCLIFGCLSLTAQSPKEIVQNFFKAMSAADTTLLSKLMAPSCALSSMHVDNLNEGQIKVESRGEFLKLVSRNKAGDLDERIYNIETQERHGISVLTMDYEFYFRGKYSHCGVDAFTLLKEINSWKIVNISDTRNYGNCRHEIIGSVSIFLDEWHHAATIADSAAYFSKLSDESVFIGTDSSEVWTKQQFLSFASPYFSKGKAWDFKKLNRNMHYDATRSIVWFDEMLDTWMGPCRGSGWIDVSQKPYQIYQYVLSVTVPNDKIKPVIELLK